MKSHLMLFITLFVFVSCQNKKSNSEKSEATKFFVSPLGKELPYPIPSEKMLEQFENAKKEYEKDSDNPENIIWYGRRTAYLGKYVEAIEIYSEGIEKFPENPTFFRHRGHRYISIRKFDEAIADFEKAVKLIEGTENEIEPDGMPNALGIPVSTLHGNIWYHLGLAYYLKHDFEKAYKAYLKCRETGHKPDNIVSSTNWLYMIQRRIGNEELASKMLEPVQEGMEIIENHDYYKLCLFYKGKIPVDSLGISDESTPSSDALKYGLANWYFCNGEKEKARELFHDILDGKAWSSFGYIAAECDVIKHFTD